MKGSLSDGIDELRDDPKTYERQIDSMTQIMDIMVKRRPHQGNAKQKCAIKKFCIFCHKHNHEQEECRSRIKNKAPCYSPTGLTYYPKVIKSIKKQKTINQNTNYEQSVFHNTA